MTGQRPARAASAIRSWWSDADGACVQLRTEGETVSPSILSSMCASPCIGKLSGHLVQCTSCKVAKGLRGVGQRQVGSPVESSSRLSRARIRKFAWIVNCDISLGEVPDSNMKLDMKGRNTFPPVLALITKGCS